MNRSFRRRYAVASVVTSLAVVAARAPTLIFGWAGGVLKSYVDAGAVDDLTGAIGPDTTGHFLPSVTKVGQIDDKLYAVPNNGVKPAVWAFQGEFTVQIPRVLAAVVLSTLPMVVLYVLGRRYLVTGLTAGFSR